ncbi:DUF6328 family protein [Streptomyces sp. NPDC059999]|uniref:DUF6328 family protein n=1 Tax=Streptomyces sp. NPDC059999 TaxID=3347030 RepID=UPI00369FB463
MPPPSPAGRPAARRSAPSSPDSAAGDLPTAVADDRRRRTAAAATAGLHSRTPSTGRDPPQGRSIGDGRHDGSAGHLIRRRAARGWRPAGLGWAHNPQAVILASRMTKTGLVMLAATTAVTLLLLLRVTTSDSTAGWLTAAITLWLGILWWFLLPLWARHHHFPDT